MDFTVVSVPGGLRAGEGSQSCFLPRKWLEHRQWHLLFLTNASAGQTLPSHWRQVPLLMEDWRVEQCELIHSYHYVSGHRTHSCIDFMTFHAPSNNIILYSVAQHVGLAIRREMSTVSASMACGWTAHSVCLVWSQWTAPSALPTAVVASGWQVNGQRCVGAYPLEHAI